MELFSRFFVLGEVRHYSSLEGDGVVKFYYTVLNGKEAVNYAICSRVFWISPYLGSIEGSSDIQI